MTTPPPIPDLEAIRGRAEKATPGPWVVQNGCSWWRIGTLDRDGAVLCPTKHPRDGQPDLTAGRGEDLQDNLDFIAHAREDIPALCDEVERVRARCAELEGALGRAAEQADNARFNLRQGRFVDEFGIMAAFSNIATLARSTLQRGGGV